MGFFVAVTDDDNGDLEDDDDDDDNGDAEVDEEYDGGHDDDDKGDVEDDDEEYDGDDDGSHDNDNGCDCGALHNCHELDHHLFTQAMKWASNYERFNVSISRRFKLPVVIFQ